MNNTKKILGFSILTSLVSKLTSLGYQILIIPFIAKLLGQNDFSLFLVYSGFSTWLALLSWGVLPTITSVAADKNRRNELPTVFISSIFLLLFIFVLLALFFLVVKFLAYDRFILFYPENSLIFWCAYAVFSINIIFSVADAVNQGQYRQHFNNIIFALANVINVISVYLTSIFFPNSSLVIIFLVSQVGFIFTRAINTIFVAVRIDSLKGHISWSFVSEFVKNSGAFFFVQLSLLISQQAIVLLCLETVSIKLSGEVSLVFRTYALLGSMITMLNQPLWPLINTARSEGNIAWITKLFKRLFFGYFVYGLFVLLVLIILGDIIFNLWTSDIYPLSREELALIGVHFLLMSLSQGCVVVLMGLGSFYLLAKVLMVESILAYFSIHAVIFFNSNIDLKLIILIFIISNLMTSFWLLPIKVFRLLRRLS